MSVKVFYTFPVNTSFVRNDEALLKQHYQVYSHYFRQTKFSLPYCFLKQFFFILRHIFSTKIYVSFFAGYSSFLPSLFSKITGRPHLIILGGSDCSSFPSIKYGCYQNKILNWFTCRSIRWATQLSPVAQSLVDVEYTYVDTDYPRQGFLYFCKTKVPYKVVHLGYDSNRFRKTKEKKQNSFLTVAQLNQPNYFRKGIDLIFAIAPKYPDYTFTIIGNTNEMKYEFVPANVKLLPFVKYEELKDIYSEHEFYFQLSIMEGFPSAPCEAMLCECIPITSNVGALPEIVGDVGFILRHKDLNELETIIRLAVNSDKQTLGKSARERIKNLFPIETRNELIDLINSLLKK